MTKRTGRMNVAFSGLTPISGNDIKTLSLNSY